MTFEEINALKGRDLDKAVAEALGYVVTRHPQGQYDYSMRSGSREENDYRSSHLPWYESQPQEWHPLLLRGVEEFGAVFIQANMETWESGGLFRACFLDYPDTWWRPMGTAVCHAYLLAFYARRDREAQK